MTEKSTEMEWVALWISLLALVVSIINAILTFGER